MALYAIRFPAPVIDHLIVCLLTWLFWACKQSKTGAGEDFQMRLDVVQREDSIHKDTSLQLRRRGGQAHW